MEQEVEYIYGNAIIHVTRIFGGKKRIEDLLVDALCRAAQKDEWSGTILYNNEKDSNNQKRSIK